MYLYCRRALVKQQALFIYSFYHCAARNQGFSSNDTDQVIPEYSDFSPKLDIITPLCHIHNRVSSCFMSGYVNVSV